MTHKGTTMNSTTQQAMRITTRWIKHCLLSRTHHRRLMVGDDCVGLLLKEVGRDGCTRGYTVRIYGFNSDQQHHGQDSVHHVMVWTDRMAGGLHRYDSGVAEGRIDPAKVTRSARAGYNLAASIAGQRVAAMVATWACAPAAEDFNTSHGLDEYGLPLDPQPS